MPLYVYECPYCGEFSKLRGITQRDDEIMCPGCGVLENFKRKIQPSYIMFPGGLPSYERENEFSEEYNQ